jgi:hypothetical protein
MGMIQELEAKESKRKEKEKIKKEADAICYGNEIVININPSKSSGVIHKISPPIAKPFRKWGGLYSGVKYTIIYSSICRKKFDDMKKDGDSLTNTNSNVNCWQCLYYMNK